MDNPNIAGDDKVGLQSDATPSTHSTESPTSVKDTDMQSEGVKTASQSSETTEPEHLPEPAAGSAASKVRYSYYEQGGLGIVCFFAKESDESKILTTLHENGTHLRVVIPMPDGSVYYRYIHLFGPAAPGHPNAEESPETAAGGLRVIPTRTLYKVEVPLKKLPVGGIIPKWPGADYVPGATITKEPTIVPAVTTTPARVSETKLTPTKTPNDWDSLESSIEQEEDESKQDIGAFFKKIFQGADEKTRLAMMKSFQTSGGTVLSTNWDEVSKTDYSKSIQPPKGQEFRTWNEIRNGQK